MNKQDAELKICAICKKTLVDGWRKHSRVIVIKDASDKLVYIHEDCIKEQDILQGS